MGDGGGGGVLKKHTKGSSYNYNFDKVWSGVPQWFLTRDANNFDKNTYTNGMYFK